MSYNYITLKKKSLFLLCATLFLTILCGASNPQFERNDSPLQDKSREPLPRNEHYYDLFDRRDYLWTRVVGELSLAEHPLAVAMTDEFQQWYQELLTIDAILDRHSAPPPEPPTWKDHVLSVATPALIIAAGIFAYLKLRRLYGRIRARRPVP
ncbi:hypothetical protein D1159_18840, partial [Pseudoflavonifractor sp. 524-17]|uniref:hypothetical protein n=1 Tax=Pseudoflavonifractor sp. 524-17 TaxID=2304577 RepID=UPI00137ADE0F